MSEKPVPETLETIAAKIDALSKSNDDRFGTIDQRFDTIDQRFDTIDQRFGTIDQRLGKIDQRFGKIDQRVDELKAQLGVKIEAVESKVDKVYDEVIAMRAETKRNAKEHKAFTKRLDNHDPRILALEKPGPAKS
jgi:archaellum component FlaC